MDSTDQDPMLLGAGVAAAPCISLADSSPHGSASSWAVGGQDTAVDSDACNSLSR